MTHPFHTRIPRTHSTYSCHTLIQHIRSTHSFPINSTRAFPSQDTLIPNSWHIHYSVLLQSLVAESLSFPSHDTFIPNSWHIRYSVLLQCLVAVSCCSVSLLQSLLHSQVMTHSFPIHGTFVTESCCSVLLQCLIVAKSRSFPSHDTLIPNSWHIHSPFVTRSFRTFIPHSSYIHVTRPFHIFTTRSFPIHGTFLPHS